MVEYDTVLCYYLGCVFKWKGDVVMRESDKSLPAYYDDNMIGFFPQGPDTVFVYWELSLDLWEAVAEMGGAFIRLYRVLENDNSEYEYRLTSEIKPPPFAANWYFEGLDQGAMYCFEIGGKLNDGCFLPLLKSETVITPPAPRFDTRPGKDQAGQVKIPQESGAKGRRLEGTGKDIKLSEVLISMPFYMGYRNLAD